jgi:hypothetical protein
VLGSTQRRERERDVCRHHSPAQIGAAAWYVGGRGRAEGRTEGGCGRKRGEATSETESDSGLWLIRGGLGSDVSDVLRYWEPTGVTRSGWLLPELWRVVAEYFTTPGLWHLCPLRCGVVCCSAKCAVLWVVVVAAGGVSSVPLSRRVNPTSLAVTPHGLLLATCYETMGVVAISPHNGQVQVVAGCGVVGDAKEGKRKEVRFNEPFGMALDWPSKSVYVVDRLNHCVRRVPLPKSVTAPKLGSGVLCFRPVYVSSLHLNGALDVV